MSTNDPKPENQPIDSGQDAQEAPPPMSYDAAARAAEEADAARATGTDEGRELADAIDQRMYFGGSEPAPGTSEEMDNVPPAGDPFLESDVAAATQPAGAPPPAGNPATIYDESPETPATVDPAQVREATTTTGTGSSIAIGCIAAAIVVVLIAVLVLTIIS